jgi:glycosyltransferase involved in cell wall biosynthesis
VIVGNREGRTPPTVSVLMAVYNGQNHVRQAIDGILAQTFQDFEFVIVDDGSTDETPRILDEYGDPRIVRLKHPENRGLIAALNTGLAAARGEFVARQDADDFSYPGRFQIQVDFLRSRPDVAVVGSNSVFEPVAGGVRTTRRVERDPLRLAWLLLFYCPLPHCSILFRRKAIQDLGGYGKEDVFVEDFALWSRVARSSRIANVGRALVIRRRPPESITSQHYLEMARAARRISLQNLEWVAGSSVSAAQLDALQAFFGNRPLSFSDALSLETRELRSAADRVVEDFWAKLGEVPVALPEFRRWVHEWMGRALLRRSRRLLTETATRSGPENILGQRLARALALNAIKMSPTLISSRKGASTALRAIMSLA